MKGRIVWFVAGSAAGVYADVQGDAAGLPVLPAGIVDQAAWRLGSRAFSDEVRDGMDARETELVEHLGLPPDALASPPEWRRRSTPSPPRPAPARARRARFPRTTSKDASPHGHCGDPPPVPRPLRERRPHGGALGVAAARRPQPAVRQRRHGAVQAVLPRSGDPAVRARHERAEVRAHPRHRGGRQDDPARHVLPDERQLLLRRLLQGRRHRARVGAASPGPSTTAGSASTPSASGSRCSTTTTRRASSGRRSPACPTSASRTAGCSTTTGTWASRAPAAPAARSTSTAAPEYGPDGGPVVDEDRFLEIWNLVFMQEEISQRPRQGPTSTSSVELPNKNIDTGMGLERVAYLLQGKGNLYEIDEVFPVIEKASELSGRTLRRRPRRTTCASASSPTTSAAA